MNAGKKSPIKGITAAVTLGVVMAACGGGTGGGATTTTGGAATTMSADTTTAPEAPTTTEAMTTTTVVGTTTTVTSEEGYQTPEELGVEIGKLSRPHQELPIVEGEVTLDDFDTEIKFTTEHSWELQATPDGPVLVDLDQTRVHEHTRVVGIFDVRPWEAETVDEWLELHDEVTVEDYQETQVGGFDAVVYDLDNTSYSSLFLEAQCWNCGGAVILLGEEYARVWAIDWDAPQPLIVFAFVKENDIEWLEKADEMVDTMEFG